MEKSTFNIYFKNVEFDNDVDLVKIKQVEDEFQDTLEFLNLNESMLKFMKEVSLRFRYLGKHKAVGLYFPLQKCLCVDLRDPSAFLHEFMHMVDYQCYKFDSLKLSSKYNFRKIKNKYIEILDKLYIIYHLMILLKRFIMERQSITRIIILIVQKSLLDVAKYI